MDVVQVIGNLLVLSFLGLLVAFNPMLIVVDIVLVLRSKRPILNTAILAAGFVASIVTMYVLASLFIDPNSQVSLRQLNDSLNIPAIIDLLAGSLLIAFAFRRLQKSSAPTSSQGAVNLRIPERSYQLFGFAFIKTALSVTNIFAVLILAKIVHTNDWDAVAGLVAMLWLLLVGVIPLAIVGYYRQFKHNSLVAIDKRINALLARDLQKLLSYGLGLVGLVFVLSGLLELLGN